MKGLESSVLDFFFLYISFMKRKNTKILKGINNMSEICFSKCVLGILKMPDIKINSVLIHFRMCEASHSWQTRCWHWA